MACSSRNEEADFSEHAACGIDTRGSLSHVCRPEPVESHYDVLIDRFDRYGMDLLVSESFKECFCIGGIGFIAQDVWTDGMGW